MSTKYWFTLKSYVYVEFKEKEILLYSTKSGNRIETAKKDIIALITQLYEPENLGVIEISEENLRTIDSTFIQEVLDKKMGDLIDIEQIPRKPICLVPVLNLQKDIEKLEKHENVEMFLSKDVGRYLQEINIYLNNTCQISCKSCRGYYKQFYCCTVTDDKNDLPIELLRRIFEQLRHLPIGTVNLLGGNIYQYKFLDKLNDISVNQDILHCYIHYKNYKEDSFVDSLEKEIIVTFPIDELILQQTCNFTDSEKTKWHFLIETEQQYDEMEQLICKFHIEEYEVHPFYTGNNMDFFKDNVFLDKEDLAFKTLSMREIFRNKKLNSNYFGTLHILADGSVRANMNTSIIGNVLSDSILDIVCKELMENTAWRVIRNTQPCNDCIYQFICPPTSDYERIMKRNNLCHISHSRL